MKTLIIAILFLSLAYSHASVEHIEGRDDSSWAQEIAASRSCFEELSKAGCEDPGEDMKGFRSCLHEAFPSLSEDCKKMMSELYR